MTELSGVREPDGAWRFASMTASAIPVKPPRDWFEDPQLSGPTALTVTPEGRVFGHAAAWGVRHIGLPGVTTAPRSNTDYRYYRTGQVETADGSMVATGRITMGAGHADLNGNITAATEHYDNVCSAIADVTTGEDEHGLWFAGALRPGATPEDIRTLRASSVSGDWRGTENGLELCGILAVNVPGFSTPRATLAASGEQLNSLVAAGAVFPATPAPIEETVMSEIKKGDYVEIVASGHVAQVVETTDGGFSVELPLSSDEVKAASEEQALAASAARTERQRMRTLEERIEQLTASLEARDRAEQAAALLDGIDA